MDYDAYYDLLTGAWLEDTCSDRDCMFCATRPEKHCTSCVCLEIGEEDE